MLQGMFKNGLGPTAMTAVRQVIFGVLSGLALGAMAASTGPATPPSPGPAAVATREAPVGRLIIRYRDGIQLAGQGKATAASERMEAASVVSRSAVLAGAGGLSYLKSVSSRLHVAALDQPLSPAQAQVLMRRLRADPAILDVQIDERAQAHFEPNDPLYASAEQWHLQDSSLMTGAVSAAGAWDISRGKGVVVGVLDGGYRPHADLLANILPGYDFISADNASDYGGNAYWTANDGSGREDDARDPGDWTTRTDVNAGFCSHEANSSWHGTHVAGLVAAQGNNGTGAVGMAFGARVLPVRVLGRCGGYTSDILAGARWAAGLAVPGVPANPNPARILNLSLGVAGPCDSTTQSVVDEIRAGNVSIVASAGNGAGTTITRPANCNGVLAVTAHTRNGRHASYANVGAGVAISAPGGESFAPVMSTWNTGSQRPGIDTYGGMAGTSMATPAVSGVLALLSSLRPDLPMAALEGYVKNTARSFPANDYCARPQWGLPAGFCGSGLLDATAALEAARPNAPDLSVTQDMLTGMPVGGELSRFTITVRNVGLQTATLVQLSASMSSEMNIESVSSVPSNADVLFSAGVLTASLESLAPGQAMLITVAARVVTSVPSLASMADVRASAGETSTHNNQDVLLLAGPALPAQAPETYADGNAGGDGGGGGGCTVAPAGQTDAGLPLLLLVALLVLCWRRRQPA